VIGSFETIDECAAKCKGTTLFFAFCIFPNYCCTGRKCKCYCESGAGDPPSCVMNDHGAIHQYWYQPKGNIGLFPYLFYYEYKIYAFI
jgi:hypothetical protein